MLIHQTQPVNHNDSTFSTTLRHRYWHYFHLTKEANKSLWGFIVCPRSSSRAGTWTQAVWMQALIPILHCSLKFSGHLFISSGNRYSRDTMQIRISSLKIEWLWVNRVLLYSTGNHTEYPIINHSGKEYEKEHVYIYIYIYIFFFIYIYLYMCVCITESLWSRN